MLKKKIYLHTGTNIGKRQENLILANQLIAERIGNIMQYSNIFETAAWGVTDQADFLNQALEVETLLPAIAVLNQINWIEREMGRIRTIKWRERIIDIDLIFYENEIIETKRLIVPHAQMAKRNFVLQPLQEIAADFLHPVLGLTVRELAVHCGDELKAISLKENQ